MSWRRVGDTAVLVELADLEEVLALDAGVRAERDRGAPWLDEVVDVLPAARTLLVTVPAGHDLDRLGRGLVALGRALGGAGSGGAAAEAGEVELEVVYDGPDLQEVAACTGLTVEEVVAAHTGTPWRAAFGGFAPGFVYLTGGDPRLQVPRRAEPRTAVPAGAVALAGGFSAVYPRSSPGGWQLLGRVGRPVWDLERDPPALVRPGMLVRFVDAGRGGAPGAGAVVTHDPRASAPGAATAPGEGSTPGGTAASGGVRVGAARAPGLTVLRPGPLATVQDLGRPGLAHLGVGRSGAADRAAHALGQRLLGNRPSCAAVELTLGGLAVRADVDCLVTLTGAPAPADVDGRPVGHAAVLRVGAGQVLRVGTPAQGLRTYLSVRGGVDLPPVLGARSTDTLAGLGPAPLAPGDRLPIGADAGALPTVDQAPTALTAPGPATLRVAPGPRLDWLADPDDLVRGPWEVSARSDRVGARLTGRALARHPSRVGDELPSEGVVRGSVQVPPGGEPVLFLADHPVTGGYPVAAVVLDADVDRAARLRPGDAVRLVWA